MSQVVFREAARRIGTLARFVFVYQSVFIAAGTAVGVMWILLPDSVPHLLIGASTELAYTALPGCIFYVTLSAMLMGPSAGLRVLGRAGRFVVGRWIYVPLSIILPVWGSRYGLRGATLGLASANLGFFVFADAMFFRNVQRSCVPPMSMIHDKWSVQAIKRKLALAIYYAFAWRLPTQPMPGWRLGYAWRRYLLKFIALEVGDDVIVKQRCYLGDGSGLRVGHRSQLGANARIDEDVIIGDDVTMGPDVVIMTNSHEFLNPHVPINRQGARARLPVVVESDVWIGTRVVILPGVTLGAGAVIGANAVVTSDVSPGAIVAGVPARIIGWRGNEPYLSN